jgi:hypothetical protein
MWAKAAKAVAGFSEGVISALDGKGMPISVRQLSLRYDAASGRMPVTIPDALDAAPGPASLVCHFHDDAMWNMRAIQLKGRVERDGEGWVFVTTAFTPPSMIAMIRGIHRSANQYLQKRGLPRPKVAFDAIERLWQQAKTIERP